MIKSPRVLAVVTLLIAGCGASELDGPEQDAAQPEQSQSAPAQETESGTVHAAWTSCITLTNQPPLSGCQTRDYWKMNTASYCPAGYYGSNVVTHDACSATGYYQYADITCCTSSGGCITLTNQPPLSGCQTRDHWKMNTASYCPSGYVGTDVVTHDACSATGYYQYADITCCQ